MQALYVAAAVGENLRTSRDKAMLIIKEIKSLSLAVLELCLSNM